MKKKKAVECLPKISKEQMGIRSAEHPNNKILTTKQQLLNILGKVLDFSDILLDSTVEVCIQVLSEGKSRQQLIDALEINIDEDTYNKMVEIIQNENESSSEFEESSEDDFTSSDVENIIKTENKSSVGTQLLGSNFEIENIFQNVHKNLFEKILRRRNEVAHFMLALCNRPESVEYLKQTNSSFYFYLNKKENLISQNNSVKSQVKSLRLPQGSTKTTTDDYEIVHIPPQHNDKKVPFHTLPPLIQRILGCTYQNNFIQHTTFKNIFYGEDNVLICAPTGSGKTNLALFALLREYSHIKNFRAVYIAPMKALVNEMHIHFHRILNPLKITVFSLSSDSQLSRQEIKNCNLLISTPEKFDIITRRESNEYSLIIIDEIHLLNDTRGATLEAITARMLRSGCRIVALSATLPNYTDVANFIRATPENTFYFSEEFRSVPLEYELITVKGKTPLKKNITINKLTLEKVMQSMGSIIIFVNSRRETINTANLLVEKFSLLNEELQENVRILLKNDDEELMDSSLNKSKLIYLAMHGIGIHHAGLSIKLRHAMETLFKKGVIRVLVSTATLAWGVNLPANTVIIKGTEVYNPEEGGWSQLSALNVVQMFGRAGRLNNIEDGKPGSNLQGKAILITDFNAISFIYQKPIESQLMLSLSDHINAEIVIGAQTLEELIDWFKFTFYWVRNPDCNYENIIMNALKCLEEEELIYRKGVIITPTVKGRIACHYYIHHSDINMFYTSLRPFMTDLGVLNLISQCKEFATLITREDEKNELNQEVPIPGNKYVILLQLYLSNVNVEKYTLYCDISYISQNTSRILRALFEVSLQLCLSRTSKIILRYYKSIENRFFPYQTPLRQFIKDKSLISEIEKKDIPLNILYRMTENELKDLYSKNIYAYLRYIPKYRIQSTVFAHVDSTAIISVRIETDFIEKRIHNKYYHIIVSDLNDEIVVYYEVIFMGEEGIDIFLPVNNKFKRYYLEVISDELIGEEEGVIIETQGGGLFSWISGVNTPSASIYNAIGPMYDLLWSNNTELPSNPTILVLSISESNFYRSKGFNVLTYHEFTTLRYIPEYVLMKDIHLIGYHYLIEISILICRLKGIKMCGLGFAGLIEEEFLKDLNVKNIGGKNSEISYITSDSFTYEQQMRDHINNLKKQKDDIPLQSSLCIFPSLKYANENISTKLIPDVNISTSKEIVDKAIRECIDIRYDSVHIIGISSYVDGVLTEYSMCDIMNYYKLSKKKCFIYLKESRKQIFLDSKIPIFYKPSASKLEIKIYEEACKGKRTIEFADLVVNYSLCVNTLEMFKDSITPNIGLKGVLELICSADELEVFKISMDERDSNCFDIIYSKNRYRMKNNRAHILIQYFMDLDIEDECSLDNSIVSHFSEEMLVWIIKLAEGLAGVCMSKGYKNPAMICLDIICGLVSKFVVVEGEYEITSKGEIRVSKIPERMDGKGMSFYVLREQKLLKWQFLEVGANGSITNGEDVWCDCIGKIKQ
ncbi:putative U5 small nuclear ribonucleoprotein [Astathelohania contejeani]|uniref:U5 small nuclear ribonucleoprotein n=1 Tax=Astathelohania contejeani TaxID=164912 RepID=A0ABQ7HZD8_9MICR|nr:putative U5 small nuclear ribonucleoprotein [Thelohania contejeani]